jgi:hypothetical protein
LKNINFQIKIFRHFEFSRKKFFHKSFIFTQNIKKNNKKMDKKIIFENIYKLKLCAAQFSKNGKLYLTLGPGVFFLHKSNKSKMKLTFCVYVLVIVGGNNFLYDYKNHEIVTKSQLF